MLKLRGDPQRTFAGFVGGLLTPYEEPAHLFIVAEEPCKNYSFEGTPSEGRLRDAPGAPYVFLTYAIGYRGGNLSGQIAMIYPRAELARQDLDWRTRAARRFSSSIEAFELMESRAVNNSLILDIGPVGGSFDLWHPLLGGNAPFAAC
jgi:hypothetical protein